MTVAAIDVPPVAVVMLPIDQLTLGLDFRLDENTDDLNELAASIAELGVLQPLVARQVVDGWEIIAGRRRLAAARAAGLTTVPCILRTLTDGEAADIALAENLHRRDLSAVEIALALKRLRDQGLLLREIAVRVGRSEGTVSAILRLLEIPAHLRDRVHRRELTYRTALDLAGRRAYVKKASGTQGAPPAEEVDASAVTYWRRRHDRLLAGITTILRRRPDTGLEAFALLRALLEADSSTLDRSTP